MDNNIKTMDNNDNSLKPGLAASTTDRAMDFIFGGLSGALYVAVGGTCTPVGAAIAGGLLCSGARSLHYIHNHTDKDYSQAEEGKEALLGAAQGAIFCLNPFDSFIINFGFRATAFSGIKTILPDIIDGKPITNSRKHQIEKDMILQFALATTTAGFLEYKINPAVSFKEYLHAAYEGLILVCEVLVGYEAIMFIYQGLVGTSENQNQSLIEAEKNHNQGLIDRVYEGLMSRVCKFLMGYIIEIEDEGQDLTCSLEHLIGEENNQDLIVVDQPLMGPENNQDLIVTDQPLMKEENNQDLIVADGGQGLTCSLEHLTMGPENNQDLIVADQPQTLGVDYSDFA